MFNFLGAIGSMLPGYIEGRERAINANWNDLNQYSGVQAKQLENLFTEATFNPRVLMQREAAAQSRMATEQAGMQNELMQAGHPGALEAAAITGNFAPYLATQNAMLQALYPYRFGAYGGGYDALGAAMGYPQLLGQQPRVGGGALSINRNR